MGRDLKGRKNNVVAVIGDGAMTAGQAYEAMNNAGYLDSDMIVILNDNKQVSLPTATLDGPVPPVGALSSALSRLQSNRPLRELREVAKVRNSEPKQHVMPSSFNLNDFEFNCPNTNDVPGRHKTTWWSYA